jgi:recombination protein RecT
MPNENQELKQVVNTQLTVAEKTIADTVQNRVNALVTAGRLNLPQDYSLGNAMSSAFLKLQKTKDRNGKPVLEACTKESIANTLLDMAIMGLSMSKDQCYPIAYGTELTCFVSVWGKIAAFKRLKGVEGDPVANLIYEGDEVELDNTNGELSIAKHVQKWESVVNGKITGAYASVKFNGQKRWAVLPMREILEGWSKSQADKNHLQFTGEFAKRSALNRLMKSIIKTTSDKDILAEVLDENEKRQFDFESTGEVVETVKKQAIEQTASQKPQPPKPADKPIVADEIEEIE